MSKITLAPNASGTGTLTIAAPNTNTDRTITLPDATGTMNISGLANEVPAGSVGSPSIYSTGDTNTGVFFPAADTVAVTTAGTERMRIDSSGNVGIGTSSPSYRVDVASADTTAGTGYAVRIRANATAAAGALQFTDSTAATQNGIIAVDTSSNMKFTTSLTERMRIDSSGNVGIGTNAPGVLLDVRNGSNTGGSGTWLTKVHQNTNTSGSNGLSVMNTWAASTSKVLELAVAWNGTTSGYYPIFQIDGINQRFSAIYGSGGSSVGATLYPEFQCRAWVNFNGTGTVAINGSGNVTSITDNGTGNYTINFTTAMPDANYSVVAAGAPTTTPTTAQRWPAAVGTLATGSVKILTPADGTTAATLGDFALVNVSVFR